MGWVGTWPVRVGSVEGVGVGMRPSAGSSISWALLAGGGASFTVSNIWQWEPEAK